jgi:hypothetical protein
MKKSIFKKNFFAIILTCCMYIPFSAIAQTREEVFQNIQRLLDNAIGEEINSSLAKIEKITRQTFTKESVSCYLKNEDKYGSEWVHRYTSIPWNDFLSHSIYNLNRKKFTTRTVTLTFKKYFPSEHFTSDETGAEPRSYDEINVYIKEKDVAEMDRNLKLLYALREKKVESAFNASIRKFSKQQTIDWLKEKLIKNAQGGVWFRNFKIISMDDCNLKLGYTGLAYHYEVKMPVKIKAVDRYGYFEYDAEVVSKRILNPDRINNGEENFSSKSPFGIGNDDEELLQNVEVAFKHLAGFCGGKSTVADNIEARKKDAEPGFSEESFSMISMKDIESLMKSEAFFKVRFTTEPLQSMEQKATFSSTYADAIKASQGSTTVKKITRTENKTSGECFQYTSAGKVKAELFFDERKHFCYYNALIGMEEMRAAVKELRSNGFTFKTKMRSDGYFVDTWKKEGYPYTIVTQYDLDSDFAHVAFLANSFLKDSKIE